MRGSGNKFCFAAPNCVPRIINQSPKLPTKMVYVREPNGVIDAGPTKLGMAIRARKTTAMARKVLCIRVGAQTGPSLQNMPVLNRKDRAKPSDGMMRNQRTSENPPIKIPVITPTQTNLLESKMKQGI